MKIDMLVTYSDMKKVLNDEQLSSMEGFEKGCTHSPDGMYVRYKDLLKVVGADPTLKLATYTPNYQRQWKILALRLAQTVSEGMPEVLRDSLQLHIDLEDKKEGVSSSMVEEALIAAMRHVVDIEDKQYMLGHPIGEYYCTLIYINVTNTINVAMHMHTLYQQCLEAKQIIRGPRTYEVELPNILKQYKRIIKQSLKYN